MSNLPSLSEWRAQTLRLTAFIPLETKLEEFLQWEQLIGEQPQKRTTQPRIGVVDEDGPFEDGNLLMHVELGRIDWRYRTILTEATLDEGIPSIGSLPEKINKFKELMTYWLEPAPALTRLAFGAELFMAAESHEAAYRLLDAYLPVVTVDPSSSDFHYSINRRRSSRSGIEELFINRLSRWSALRVSMAIHKSGLPPVETPEPLYACRAEIDINTAPDSKRNLPSNMLGPFFQELVDLGLEIAKHGDIP